MPQLMRVNPVRDKLLAGETSFGTMAFEFFTPGLPGVLAKAGAEWVIFDTEHSGIGIETIKSQIAASRGSRHCPDGARRSVCVSPRLSCTRCRRHGNNGPDDGACIASA